MAEKGSDPPTKAWGEYLPSTWRRKSEQSEVCDANSTCSSKSGSEETEKPSSKTWGEMLPALASASWKKSEHADDETKSHESGEQAETGNQVTSPTKTWGDMMYPTSWRPGKSRDGSEQTEIAKEVLKEEPISSEEPSSGKLKGKCEDAEKSSQVSAKTWGEMIHPALAWRRKSKDDAGTSEPTPNESSEPSSEDVADELSETSDEVPRAAEGTLGAVAASIKRSIAGMSRWSMADLTLGLYKLSARHALEGAADTIDGSRVTSGEELQELTRWFRWAYAAYKKNKEKLASEIEIDEAQVIKHVFTSGVLKPAYFIAVDNARRCVVMSIRGTLAATDVLTDLNPHSEKFEGGFAHSGMLAAARWLMENEAASLRELLTSNPEYRLVLVGHSLGAGTAALLCMLLRDYDGGRLGPLSKLGIPPSWISSWGFGCPPCVDKRLAEEACFIRNIVLQDDVVARISPGALEDLRSEIVETDWSHAFKDGSKGRKMLELAQSTLPSVAMKYGSAALVVARSGALAGTRIHKAANWFTVGIAAAELLKSAAASYTGVSTNESDVAGAAVAATAAETSTDPKECFEMERLYVPGILYHILRKPLNPETAALSSLPAQTDAPKDEDGASKKGGKHSPKKTTKHPQFQHIVVRGDDPSSRFKRIVLSSTLLSDHGCHQYKESLEDAVSWLEHES